MIKKIIGGIAIAAIAGVMTLNVSFSAKNNNSSDISLANVEALADYEITVGPCFCRGGVSSACLYIFDDGDYLYAPNSEVVCV